jgi:predicted nucleotidyltransferase
MRLTEFQQNQILTLLHQQWGKDASVWLFGSRLDDQKRGGDVDLLVETPVSVPLIEKYLLQDKLEAFLGVRVDLLLSVVNQVTTDFVGHVKQVGVKL